MDGLTIFLSSLWLVKCLLVLAAPALSFVAKKSLGRRQRQRRQHRRQAGGVKKITNKNWQIWGGGMLLAPFLTPAKTKILMLLSTSVERFGVSRSCCQCHSPPPIASWILHTLATAAATTYRDEPSWLFAEVSERWIGSLRLSFLHFL